MSEVITTAGRAVPTSPTTNPRREAIKAIRAALRNQDATDAEVDDAIEALVELAKE